MADTINQASANPTNKLTAATLAAAVLPVGSLVLRNLAPEWYDPEVMLGLMPVAVFVLGWFVRDAPNIVVVQEQPK